MAWADANYQHKKEITIDHTLVEGDETDFPVLIKITDGDLTGCLANGHDIKFYESTETIQLKHERVEWNNATGYLIAYVKIPSLSSTVDTTIYMYYEYNAEGGDQADPTNVWDSDFIIVLHCNDADTQLTDSTSNGYDFPEVLNPDYRETGKIGYACYADNAWRQNNGDCWELNDNSFKTDFHNLSESTIEWWTACDQTATGTTGMLMSIKHDGGDDVRMVYEPDNPNGTGFLCDYDDGPVDYRVDDRVHTWAANEWHYGAAAQNNTDTDMEVYVDGDSVGVDNLVGTFSYNTADGLFTIASRHLAAYAAAYDGKLEEIRFSGIDREDNWIKTSYNTENDPSSFMSFGAEQNQSTAWTKDLSETLSLSESIEKEVELNKSDSLSLSESFGRQVDFERGLTESLSLSESIYQRLGRFFRFPLKHKIYKRYKYKLKNTEKGKYRKKDGKKYKYRVKKQE